MTSHPQKMKKPYIAMFMACLCLIALSCSCHTTKQEEKKKEDVNLSSMTPEERENYLAIQRARQRANEKIELEAANGRRHNANLKEKKKRTFSWVPHSIEKRERLRSNEPVLLQDNSSIFEWRKDSTPRSEKLHESVVHPDF